VVRPTTIDGEMYTNSLLHETTHCSLSREMMMAANEKGGKEDKKKSSEKLLFISMFL
jgi:hypothetical protein